MNCEACGHQNVDGARFCANCGVTIHAHIVSDDPLVGKVVGGRYRITKVIGEGGMGIVYEGEQQMGTTVRKVAVKTLHTELSRDPSVTARFHRECGTVAQLEHPNTIKVYDFGTMPDGTLYIAMEHLAGKPLDKVIEEAGAMAPQRVLKLLRQICGSLEEAHGQGIVHRDLKPENVILVNRAGESDVVKLLDFGIAARTESADAAREAKLTQQGMVLGTPPYMSPEQFTGKALDKRSDIYSLAVMAYEMLTGKLPFDATTPWQWATEHMTSQPRPFETMEVSTAIPKPMRDAILRALAKDRDDRFDTVTDFVTAMASGAELGPPSSGADAASKGSSATAAMEAAPDFGAPVMGSAPTAAMPAQPMPSPGGYGGQAAAARVPAPPPADRSSSGGNKGLIYGLGGLAALLVAGIGYALVGGGGGDEDPVDPLLTATPTAPATIAPLGSTPEPAPDTDDDPTAQAGDDTPPEQGGNGRPVPTGGVRPPGTTPPTPGTQAPTTPTPPRPPATTPPPSSGDACKECIEATGSSITLAAAKFQQCSDAQKKKTCSDRAKRRAPQIAKSQADRHDCAKARQTQAAANSMNAGSSGLDKIVQNCN
jgi:eukaryotic-like serine/threonine-protein kinase